MEQLAEKIEQHEREGFPVLPNILSPSEVAALRQGVETVIAVVVRHAPKTGTRTGTRKPI